MQEPIAIEQPIVTPDVLDINLRRLAAEVINQAVRDWKPQIPLREQIRLFLWLTGPEFEQWKSWANADGLSAYSLLPRLREARRALKGKRR